MSSDYIKSCEYVEWLKGVTEKPVQKYTCEFTNLFGTVADSKKGTVSVDLGFMALKQYSTFPEALELEPRHQIVSYQNTV